MKVKVQRYDNVTVNTNYTDKKTCKEGVSNNLEQVIMIIQIKLYEKIQNKKELKHNKWYLIVEYMRKSALILYDKPHTVNHREIEKLIWDQRKDCKFLLI